MKSSIVSKKNNLFKKKTKSQKSKGNLDLVSSRGSRKLALGQIEYGGNDDDGNNTGNFADLPF